MGDGGEKSALRERIAVALWEDDFRCDPSDFSPMAEATPDDRERYYGYADAVLAVLVSEPSDGVVDAFAQAVNVIGLPCPCVPEQARTFLRAAAARGVTVFLPGGSSDA